MRFNFKPNRPNIEKVPDIIRDMVGHRPMGVDCRIQENRLFVTLEVDFQKAREYEPLRQDIQNTLEKLYRDYEISVVMTAHTPKRPKPSPEKIHLPHVKRVIAIASGKGGVGKSTVAAWLARALKTKGMNVGLLDADIYGPSIPTLFQLHEQPEVVEGKIQPLRLENIDLLSIGFLMNDQMPLIWRGPMVISALKQLLGGASWGSEERKLDFLLIDLPPGTGDAHLSLVQNVNLDGAIIISTPDELSVADARKGLLMFKKTGVKVLGVVQNMSYLKTPTGDQYIFGKDGAKKLAQEHNVPLLAEIPILPNKNTDDFMPLAKALLESGI